MRIPNAILLAATVGLALTLTACSKPEPDPAEPLDPQASADATDLRDAINEPLDKARAVEATQAAEEAERQQSLEETGG